MDKSYDRAFFDWVRLTGLASADRVLPLVHAMAGPRSVVDVGCGEGAWLSVWARLGIETVAGLDGDYVGRHGLMIDPACFTAADLSVPFATGRRFDLAQSLEVAEHLPPGAALGFVRSLCAASDVVLFSAAQPGQGGENHVNERPVSYWAGLFAAQGYAAFDALRPALRDAPEVAPWYRFNTVLYANAAGRARLAPPALSCEVTDLARLDGGGDRRWRIRKACLRPLPMPVVSWLSRAHYRLTCRLHALRRESRVRRNELVLSGDQQDLS